MGNGYMLIDTAFAYDQGKTEPKVGCAVKNSGKNCFIVTKHWRDFHGYDRTMECLKESLKRLEADAVDLYLMHWPGPGSTDAEWDPDLRLQTWKAMEDAHDQGLCKAIGVSNFEVSHLKHLLPHCRHVPHVNQIEVHPYNYDPALLEFCAAKGIVVQAYASLGGQQGGNAKLLEDPTVKSVAEKMKKTPAQVLLRWALEKGMAILPKATSDERQRENAAIFDFRLSDDDVSALDALSAKGRERQTWTQERPLAEIA